jgi:predicted secreted protein
MTSVSRSHSHGINPVATSILILNAHESDTQVHDRSFFDKEFYEAKVQNKAVELLGIEAALTDLELQDVATINAVQWYVIGINPDDTGLVTITLSSNPI